MGLKSYLRTNWGAPFIIIFMILLIISAFELSYGLSDTANETAVYAFYFLVAGVALQIASYVKFGEGKTEEKHVEKVEVQKEEPEKTAKPEEKVFTIKLSKRQLFALIITVLIIVSLFGVLYYYGNKVQQILPHQTYEKLTGIVSFSSLIKEPDGTAVASVGISVRGGELPYSFIAVWSDNFVQNSSMPVFTRNFNSTSNIPSTVTINVRSADGQSIFLVAKINSTS